MAPMPESEFERRVRQGEEIVRKNLAKEPDADVHRILETGSDAELEGLVRKHGPHLGQAELSAVMKRLRTHPYLAPVVGAKPE